MTSGMPLEISVDGRSTVVPAGSTVMVGRDPDCDVQVDDPRVSRHHLHLDLVDGGWRVTDTSSNGTYRDGTRITALELEGTARLRLGDALAGPTLELRSITDPSDITDPSTVLGARSAVHAAGQSAITIGRDPSNDVVLSDLSVSRYHAELRISGDHKELIDLQSFNGTFVNGQPAKRQLITESDVVTIGSHALRCEGGNLFEYIDQERVSLEVISLSVPAPSGVTIINDVSFVLPSNSLTAIVGPSGSGKTTLLKGIAGDRPASGGTVLYQGRNLFENLPALRPRFGFVPQDDVLHRELSIEQSLRFAASLRFPPDTSKSERDSRIHEVAGELGLIDRLELPVGQLSGGQRKRVSVAFELLTQPSVVFLDEPTSGLDPGYERSLMLMLRRLADGGRTLLLVTHATESLALCNRVLFLARGGRIAYFGQPHKALEFFEGDDYADVFRRLDKDTTDWASRYKALVETGRATPALDTSEPPRVVVEPSKRTGRRSAIRQIPTLLRRELALLASDRRRLLLLLLQAPILGALFLFALNRGQLALPTSLVPRFSRLVVVALVLGITWIALAATLREIVSHRKIYERERAVGLSPFAYVTAKVLVFGSITVIQAAAFSVLAILFQEGPADGAVLPWGTVEVMIGVALIGLAAMSLGLLVSAACSTADQAMAMFPLLLVIQLLFSGLFPSITEDPIGARVAYATSAQWGFSAIASTVDLNALEQYNNLVIEFQRKGPNDLLEGQDPAVLIDLVERWRAGDLTRELTEEQLAAIPLVTEFVNITQASARGEPLPQLSEDVFGDLGNPAWGHDPDIWYRSAGALTGLFAAAYLGTWLVIRLKDRRLGR